MELTEREKSIIDMRYFDMWIREYIAKACSLHNWDIKHTTIKYTSGTEFSIKLSFKLRS